MKISQVSAMSVNNTSFKGVWGKVNNDFHDEAGTTETIYDETSANYYPFADETKDEIKEAFAKKNDEESCEVHNQGPAWDRIIRFTPKQQEALNITTREFDLYKKNDSSQSAADRKRIERVLDTIS
jgi:hypothetical protein